ncbi:MAG: transcriptional regulator [Magnetococcales bacterium]|nr:transcriptional regulator [Magnetococcales bacterium]
MAKGTRYRLSRRDHEMFSEQHALGPVGLAKKYQLSVQRVYKIIARVRQKNIANRQRTLNFSMSDEDSER